MKTGQSNVLLLGDPDESGDFDEEEEDLSDDDDGFYRIDFHCFTNETSFSFDMFSRISEYKDGSEGESDEGKKREAG